MGMRAWVVAAVAVVSGEASADGVFLNARGQAQRAKIEALVRPAKIERAGPRVFIRGRLVDAHPRPGGYVVQFQPSWQVGTRQVFAKDAVPIESDVIQMLGIDVDSHLDLQLALSSRDDANRAAPPAQRTRAPIGSPAWHTRLGRILHADGPTEPPRETGGLVHRGWVMFHLVEDPPPGDTADPPASARYLAAAQARFLARIQAGGVDLLHPSARTAHGDDAVRGLIYGAARARRYAWADQDDPTIDAEMLGAARGPGEGKDLSERAVIAASYLCGLAETPRQGPRQRCPAGQACVPEPVLQPTGERIAQFGADARTGVLSVLDNARAGVPDVIAMYEPAAMPVEPAEAAQMALRVLERCQPIWDPDGARVVASLIPLAGELPPGATAAQRALRTEARRALIANLRPDFAAVRAPELAKRRADAHEMRRAFSTLVIADDPELRATAQSIVLDGGAVQDVVSEDLVDWLFAIALNPTAPEGDGSAEPRASRRWAITMLMVLGTLADPKHPTAPGSHPIAQRILERVRAIRAAKAASTAGQGQLTFLVLLGKRAGESDGAAAPHVRRFAKLMGS